MVLLALEAAGLHHTLIHHSEGSIFHNLALQLDHHPWHGLRFWDLIQPGFMFIAGTAMAYSLHFQNKKGVSWNQSFLKALKRSGWLFFWGVLIYAVKSKGLSFELWNVLTQLSFTLLVAFLIYNLNYKTQIIICFGILLLTEILYRFTNVEGFNEPFVDQKNFGNYVDLLLMNKINSGGWVAINCLPTAVHTIAGALIGKLFLSQNNQTLKIIYLSGIICLVLGYALDLAQITPIIKRIATTSFTLVSLGYCLLALGLSYYIIDLKQRRNKLEFFTIVGMNSIFIYLFFEIPGMRWFNGYIGTITGTIMGWLNMSAFSIQLITSLIIFGLMWGMCYFLYKKKIFFKV